MRAFLPNSSFPHCFAVANPGADGFLSALKGVDKVTSVLQEAVVDSFRNPDAYFAFGLNRPVGILLHGTPGTGKRRSSMLCACSFLFYFMSISLLVLG